VASVLNRATLQFIKSANTPDFDKADWIIEPDLSLVQGVDKKYWKLDGDRVLEMDTDEKQAVDDALAAAVAQASARGLANKAIDNGVEILKRLMIRFILAGKKQEEIDSIFEDFEASKLFLALITGNLKSARTKAQSVPAFEGLQQEDLDFIIAEITSLIGA
jgi:hypothetical protein